MTHPPAAARFVMPWMCLERCGDTADDIAFQLQQLATNTSVFTGVAFEDYNLGPNSTLVKNNLTQVAPAIKQLGLQRWAMISSYPYPPQFLTWMRQAFAAPQPFIEACLAAARAADLTGFNVDWEPVSGSGAPTPTPQDAADYAAFLTTLADALHAESFQLSVDVATWSPIWNFTELAATHVDYVMTMGTYTDDDSVWQQQLAYAVQTLPPGKLVVGLETVMASNGANYSSSELALRFNAMAATGATQTAVWRMPVPDNWWPFLRAV